MMTRHAQMSSYMSICVVDCIIPCLLCHVYVCVSCLYVCMLLVDFATCQCVCAWRCQASCLAWHGMAWMDLYFLYMHCLCVTHTHTYTHTHTHTHTHSWRRSLPAAAVLRIATHSASNGHPWHDPRLQSLPFSPFSEVAYKQLWQQVRDLLHVSAHRKRLS